MLNCRLRFLLFSNAATRRACARGGRRGQSIGANAVLTATAPGRAIIEPMPANDRMPCLWSRRSLLVALTVGSMTALSGCRVRLEGDAPRTPTPPARQPMRDEQALLTARRDAVRLRDLAAGLGGAATPTTELLATVHGLQADVFESVLRSGGVPPAEIITATAPAQGASGVADLIAAEGPRRAAGEALGALRRRAQGLAGGPAMAHVGLGNDHLEAIDSRPERLKQRSSQLTGRCGEWPGSGQTTTQQPHRRRPLSRHGPEQCDSLRGDPCDDQQGLSRQRFTLGGDEIGDPRRALRRGRGRNDLGRRHSARAEY